MSDADPAAPGHSPVPSIAIIGAGPRGTSVLERIVANARECAPGLCPEVHVFDPFPPGGGRVWRSDQSALLWSNTRADDCTLFTDASVSCAGPILPGPTLAQWARALGSGDVPHPRGFRPRADTAAEAASVHDGWFATRALVGDYLAWVFHRTVAAAAPGVRVRLHAASVVDIRDLPDGRQRISSTGREPLDVDVVVHAQGNFRVDPYPQEAILAEYATRHRLTHLPTTHDPETAQARVEAGEPVLVRGLGLAFVDTMMLLTEGRGGVFHRDASGTLRYEPSGHEPVMHVGSRRGVPYRSKFGYTRTAAPEAAPRYLDPDVLGDRVPDFLTELWPLIAHDLAGAGYRELAHAHPERLSTDPAAFLAALENTAWNSPDYRELVTRAVPDPRDRIDLDGLDRPLAGRRFAHPGALRDWMIDYLAADVERGRDPRHSAHLAVYHRLLTVSETLWTLVRDHRLSPGSTSRGLPEFFDFCRFRTSGPPGPRVERLLALIRAGIVHPLGAGLDISARDGAFHARSVSVDTVVRAKTLIEARLPGRDLGRVNDPLLVRMTAHGGLREQTRIDPVRRTRHPTGMVDTVEHRVRRRDGSVHRGRFFLDPGDFPRPRSDAGFLRHSDEVARQALYELVALAADAARAPAESGAPLLG
ncbi:FAD/NAD(P)-binding protein [Embleya sp. NPDC059237]|uniref:FAD/NAD(P)-binding protein n=1 Tax=Embleya sp. NPDC059237 TaxID=3346784 RepID=UPI003678435A